MTHLRRILGATTRATLAVMLICLASAEALAGAARWWVVESKSGQVQLVKMGISPIALTHGDVFAVGDWIETGPDGHAVLRRGEETIVVAPDTRIGLPTDKTGPFATRILQSLGTILLTVEKKAEQHFEVVTPHLTAVVKGTTFTVGIQGTRAAVHVVNGLVEVKNLASGHSTLVRPGQTGAVLRGGAPEVQIEGGAGAAIEQAASQAPTTGGVDAQASAGAPVVEAAGKDGTIRINRALGPKTLDLSESSKGLIRAHDRAPARAAAGKPTSAELAGQTDVAKARDKGAKARAPGQSVGAGLRNPGGSGLDLDRNARAGLNNPGGTGLALGKGAGAGLSNPGGNGLALGKGVSAGLSSPGGGGLALGKGAAAGSGPGKGLAVGQGLTPNPGLGHGNAAGNGKGRAKGKHE